MNGSQNAEIIVFLLIPICILATIHHQKISEWVLIAHELEIRQGEFLLKQLGQLVLYGLRQRRHIQEFRR